MCEQIHLLLSSSQNKRGTLKIQIRECLTSLLKDLEWIPGMRKSGFRDVKVRFQNAEHLLSMNYDTNNELLIVGVDSYLSAKKISMFDFSGNLARLLSVSINEVYLKLAGLNIKTVINLFGIEQNQEGETVFGKYVPRTRFYIKYPTDELWKEYNDRFNMVWSSNIWLTSPYKGKVASEFKNVALTFILEKYLTARSMEGSFCEEILDLGGTISFTGCFAFGNCFSFFDVPFSYFDKVHLSWPWHGEDNWPITWGVCRDFTGVIVSAEIMEHNELNPFYDNRYYSTSSVALKHLVAQPLAFSHQWLKRDGRIRV